MANIKIDGLEKKYYSYNFSLIEIFNFGWKFAINFNFKKTIDS